MASRPEAVAAVETKRVVALLLILFASVAYAGESNKAGAQDREADESNEEARLEWMSFRFSTYFQRGHRGYQSQAETVGTGPGSESVQIYQPIAFARIRQSRSIVHNVAVPIDIVSSASTDALDAIGHASRENEAGSIDVTTILDADKDFRYILHYGFHIEEPFKAVFAGFGIAHDFAEHNATIASSVELIYDGVDDLQFWGEDLGWRSRGTANVNVSLSQILTPTTLVSASYGLTTQFGELETSYNSTPIDTGGRMSEKFPSTRVRQALSVRIAQMIQPTRTTLRASYRAYTDTFGLFAHTADIQVFQYITRTLLLRASYRFHTQTGVDFFRSNVPSTYDVNQPRTSDSDLQRFDAHEVGGGFRIYFDDGPLNESSRYLDAMYYRYSRSNGLNVDLASVGYGQMF